MFSPTDKEKQRRFVDIHKNLFDEEWEKMKYIYFTKRSYNFPLQL